MKTHDFTVDTADGSTQRLSDYAGKVLLVVNTASKCGLTPQYEGLEKLYREFGEQGLEVLGFPSNQFMGQEPGTDEEIQEFCSTQYGVTFPVFAKVDVNGPDAHPLWSYLRAADPGDFTAETAPGLYDHIAKIKPDALGTDEVKWNFTKFLIGRDGEVVRRYEPSVTPDQIRSDIETALAG
ncbi:glutathione peroxidase [Trujillonella endophytica]|uniref:Glutathione peroxidase n=1 Tax=Trujillonella endophytica TaxID=673521 RepID=A0A1H8SGA1_9ACTN|nr:glutathione peroxidase [Trujillella endophytica]SEO77682.1 glutathione peroxidase [Trujillella endophytica]